MHLVSADSLNEAVVKAIKLIDAEGIESTSKSNVGPDATNIQVYNTLIKITNPRDRYLDIIGRKNNIFAMIAETFWTLAGDDKVDPYLSFYLPRAADFSDDGLKWRAAYGPRIYEHDQLQGVLDQLQKNTLTRQAVIGIYDQTLDSQVHLPNGTKDIPCNNMIYLYSTPVNPDNINLHVIQRSGDVIWGLGSINIFIWTILQEIVANMLDKDVGYYTHYVNNLHVYKSYEVAYNQFQNVIKGEEDNFSLTNEDLNKITGFSGWNAAELKQYFAEVLKVFTAYIVDQVTSDVFSDCLNDLKVLITNNGGRASAIIEMMEVLEHFTIAKKEKGTFPTSVLESLSPGLHGAVKHSTFVKLESAD